MSIESDGLTKLLKLSIIVPTPRSQVEPGNKICQQDLSINQVLSSLHQVKNMRFSQLSLMVSIALSLNIVGISLPVTPSTRSLLAPAAAQTVDAQLDEANRLLAQGLQQLDTSQFQEAFQSWQQALTIYRDDRVKAGNPSISRSGEASALGNLGILYDMLNDSQQAIEYHQQALPIFQELGDRNSEAKTLLNLGAAYAGLGQHQKGIEYYEQALPIYREVGDRNGEAKVLTNLGVDYGELKQSQKAIEYSEQALLIYREVGDRRGEAIVLMNLGIAHGNLREYQQAIDYHRQALPIFRDLGDRDNEGFLLASIGSLYANYDSPESAIQFLQQSVEVRESIRKQMQQLPQPVQQSYADSLADDYQLLADLLKQQNRNTEAQQVLDLLK
jgi:tetratricopeptide (TPR) repeat protein